MNAYISINMTKGQDETKEEEEEEQKEEEVTLNYSC